MPPGPVFNWFCVAHSFVDILSHAVQIRAAQIPLQSASVGVTNSAAARKRHAASAARREAATTLQRAPLAAPPDKLDLSTSRITSRVHQQSDSESPTPSIEAALTRHIPIDVKPATKSGVKSGEPPVSKDVLQVAHQTVQTSGAIETNSSVIPGIIELAAEPVFPAAPSRKLQSSKVPSSRIGRFFHYGGLAASLGYGAASELLRRSTSSDDHQSPSLVLTEGNVKRLVAKLTQLRGAALKLGQFMSIQDSHVLPPEIEDIFRRVQDSAHYMPDWQMEEVLRGSLGPSWQDNFESFDRLPFAAASIGQVHSAVLAASSSPTGRPEKVAVKIQFPNIVNSIESDLGYLKVLLTAGRLLPKGLFLDRTIQVMKAELADECDYSREAGFLRKFASPEYLGNDPQYKVPWVWDGSTEQVLVMEHVNGVSVGGSIIDSLNQQDRNDIATRIIDLCLKELFVLRTMQTDPNWTNFLWNTRTRQVELVDFGATREYTKEFMDNWLHLLQAAASGDREACIEWSLKLGYLTGEENDVMLDAHVRSMALLATPFKADTPQPFSFGPGSQWAAITADIRAQIPVMLKYRLTPPPRETYSLNRKLSGAFLLASRLQASVDCKVLWDNIIDNYHFGVEPKK